MGTKSWIVAAWAVALSCCGGAGQAGRGGTTAVGEGAEGAEGAENSAQRFEALLGSAQDLSQELVAQLPEVAEESLFLVVEATVPAPSYDAVLGGWAVAPPEAWAVGTTAEGEEIRVEMLEVEGGAMVVEGPAEAALSDEVTVTWVARYERRNTLLTEAGSSLAVHVVPVAARLESEGQEPRYWISGEAPTQ